MFEQTNTTATTAEVDAQVSEADRLIRAFAQILRESANKIESSRDGLRAAATALKNSSERTRQLVLGGTAERAMKEVRRNIYNMVVFLHEQESIHQQVMGTTATNNDNDDDEEFT